MSENKFDHRDQFFTQITLDLKKDFFKSIFFISTGTLAASITLTQASATKNLGCLSYLYWSWFFLGVTTAFVLMFFLISESRFKLMRQNINFKESEDFGAYETFIEGELEEYLLKQEYSNPRRLWIKYRHKVVNVFYKYLSLLSSITFIIGFICMAFYVKNLLL